ncbi:MAG: hypothetical protein FOGNACKC_00939 [Anaerolineae bacterium]|nr:hypothetical protein [Anaerolineae bacterium]
MEKEKRERGSTYRKIEAWAAVILIGFVMTICSSGIAYVATSGSTEVLVLSVIIILLLTHLTAWGIGWAIGYHGAKSLLTTGAMLSITSTNNNDSNDARKIEALSDLMRSTIAAVKNVPTAPQPPQLMLGAGGSNGSARNFTIEGIGGWESVPGSDDDDY